MIFLTFFSRAAGHCNQCGKFSFLLSYKNDFELDFTCKQCQRLERLILRAEIEAEKGIF